jgi:hypothetical protein
MQAYGEWGVAAKWEGGSESQWSETKKLQSLDPTFRAKVVALMQRMRERGENPMLFYGWRGLETQARLQSGGTSDVSFSFHNVVNSAGEPAALGADIVDRTVWWGEASPSRTAAENAAAAAKAERFFSILGTEAKRLGLFWGGDWSKPDKAHVQLYPNSRLGALRAASLPLLQAAGDLRTEVLEALERGRQRVSRAPLGRTPRYLPYALLGLVIVGGIAYTVTRRKR